MKSINPGHITQDWRRRRKYKRIDQVGCSNASRISIRFGREVLGGSVYSR